MTKHEAVKSYSTSHLVDTHLLIELRWEHGMVERGWRGAGDAPRHYRVVALCSAACQSRLK